MNKLIYFLITCAFITHLSAADIIKPNSNIEPYQVIKIQLKSLQKNNSPSIDNGIEQAWEFAHPSNKKSTGPLGKFKIMLKGKSYKVLLDHLDHEIIQENLTDSVALFEVRVLGKDKSYYKFKCNINTYTFHEEIRTKARFTERPQNNQLRTFEDCL